MTDAAPAHRPDGRPEPSQVAPERDTLGGVLDLLRATVLLKARGLTDDQARTAACPPSTLTVAGIVSHLSGVERFWFTIDFAGDDVAHPWTAEDPHGGFHPDTATGVDALLYTYQLECARSRHVVRANDLDELSRGDVPDFSLRYALTHLIQETARHCGHLDLLREALDGATGE